MAKRTASGSLRLILATLVLYHCLIVPLRYVLAWLWPAQYSAVGVLPMHKLSHGTVSLAILVTTFQFILLLSAFWNMWIVLNRFENGVFFSKEIVQRIQRAGSFLLITATMKFSAILIGIASFSLSTRHVEWISIVTPAVTRAPTGLFICGLLAYLVSAAFNQAVKMQHEARLTV